MIVQTSEIIHFGIPDVKTYVQQTGHAGRDGKLSNCTMLVGKGVCKIYANAQILNYCQNKDTCRRDLLYSNFNSYFPNQIMFHTCKCFDICSAFCNCYKCNDCH